MLANKLQKLKQKLQKMCSDNYPSTFPSGPHVSIISFHPPHTADRQIFSRLTLRFLVANSDSGSSSDELVIIIVINVILFKTHTINKTTAISATRTLNHRLEVGKHQRHIWLYLRRQNIQFKTIT